jgi:hypothetical protein
MGYLPSSLGSKAAHFVSDLTTVILNPISEREPSSPLPVRPEISLSLSLSLSLHLSSLPFLVVRAVYIWF